MNIILYIATSIPAVSLLNNRVTNEKITTRSCAPFHYCCRPSRLSLCFR